MNKIERLADMSEVGTQVEMALEDRIAPSLHNPFSLSLALWSNEESTLAIPTPSSNLGANDHLTPPFVSAGTVIEILRESPERRLRSSIP